MAKARFYIQDNVQEVGYRSFVIEQILDSDLNGTARNLPDRRVEVLLEGEKEHILDFIERLKKEKPELAKNPSLAGIEFNDSLIVPDIMKSSQALLCGQFSKAVIHVIGIEKGIGELKEGFGELNQEFRELKEGFGELNQEFRELKEGFDKLPERIAAELKKVLK